ncbi:unnamed protein product [Microthlaspi erraticum]|uniref:Uncharacterized protein n=1 Tax=Microthlaspi erraticum TaxID=1685480 RepID=A0A6D2JWJ1_9BRAS|nr:unnamed protein product [Microthlaspi erraticum]
MGREEQGRTWCMDAAQLDTQRKKEEVILKTSSTIRSSSSTRPAKLQLDRAEKSTVKPEKCCFPLDFPLTLNLIPLRFYMEVMEIVGKGPLRAPITLALEMEFIGVGWISLSNDPMASKA